MMADAVAEGRMEERVASAGGMQAMCLEIRNACGALSVVVGHRVALAHPAQAECLR